MPSPRYYTTHGCCVCTYHVPRVEAGGIGGRRQMSPRQGINLLQRIRRVYHPVAIIQVLLSTTGNMGLGYLMYAARYWQIIRGHAPSTYRRDAAAAGGRSHQWRVEFVMYQQNLFCQCRLLCGAPHDINVYRTTCPTGSYLEYQAHCPTASAQPHVSATLTQGDRLLKRAHIAIRLPHAAVQEQASNFWANHSRDDISRPWDQSHPSIRGHPLQLHRQ